MHEGAGAFVAVADCESACGSQGLLDCLADGKAAVVDFAVREADFGVVVIAFGADGERVAFDAGGNGYDYVEWVMPLTYWSRESG